MTGVQSTVLVDCYLGLAPSSVYQEGVIAITLKLNDKCRWVLWKMSPKFKRIREQVHMGRGEGKRNQQMGIAVQ